MVKYCIRCGTALPHMARFCLKCGKNLQPPKKSTKLLIVTIIVAAAIVIGVALFIIFQDDTSRFIGTWEVEIPYAGSSSSTAIWTFYENGTLKMTTYSLDYLDESITFDKGIFENTLTVTNVEKQKYYASSTQWASWEVKDDKLYLKPILNETSSPYSSLPYGFGMDYEFTNDNQFTLMLGFYPITCTKTSESAVNQSLTLDTMEWKNINITVYGLDTVHWDWVNLTRSSINYYGDYAPSEWGNVNEGDVLKFGEYNSEIYVSLGIIEPTSSYLGSWSFEPKETLYVGGSGDYSSIQSAIDNASDGDTIYIYSGVYNERVSVDKSIRLIGENKNTTIIDSKGAWDVVYVSADRMSLTGFTIRNTLQNDGNIGVHVVFSDNCIISDNIITGNLTFGLDIGNSDNNIVTGNTILNITQCGICIGDDSGYNIVKGNYIENCSSDGIWLEGSSYNNISENIVTKCGRGMLIISSSVGNIIHANNITYTKSKGIGLYSWPEEIYYEGSPENNIIFQNNLENCGRYGEFAYLNNGDYGIYIWNAYNNSIYYNNFVNNIPNSQACDNSNNTFYNTSTLMGNYWDHYTGEDADGDGVGDTPYKIFCGYNQDPYPLMNPIQI